jgi:hypothetical protein
LGLPESFLGRVDLQVTYRQHVKRFVAGEEEEEGGGTSSMMTGIQKIHGINRLLLYER